MCQRDLVWLFVFINLLEGEYILESCWFKENEEIYGVDVILIYSLDLSLVDDFS